MVDIGIIFLALDTPSPDDPLADTGYGKVSPIHSIFLSNGVILAEYLNNTLDITATEIKLTALPLRIAGADGFPARVIAEF